MINSKITTDIMTTTKGLTIDIPPAKVVINNQEITDLETFNKAVDSIKEKDKEIEMLTNELSIKTTYIEDLLKLILKSTDIKIQKEVYEHGIVYDKKLKELKEKNND